MERAIWLGGADERVVMDIYDIRREGRSQWAKAQRFICPDENCHVPVIAVFPDIEKAGRKKSPRAYFRATQSAPHKPGCRRQAAADLEGVTGIARQGNSTALAGSYPSRFLMYPPKQAGGLGRAGQLPSGPTTGTVDDHVQEGVARNSRMSTRLLSVLVEAYEHPRVTLESMEIHIPACPARTYAQAFISPSRAAEMAGSDKVYVFAGLYAGHSVYASGISIQFKEMAQGNLKTSVWVANGLNEPPAYHRELVGLLETADHSPHARLYALGKFIRTHGKYAIEVESVSLVHLTFQLDDQQP